jgi:hypothetical protein
VPEINGNMANQGAINLRDVRIDFPGALGADASTYNNRKDGKAVLLFTLVNSSADTPDPLTGLTTDAGTVHVTAPMGETPLVIPANGTVVAGPAPISGQAQQQADITPGQAPVFVEIDDLSRDLTPGLTVDVKFTFAENGTVDVPVPIDAGPDTPRMG